MFEDNIIFTEDNGNKHEDQKEQDYELGRISTLNESEMDGGVWKNKKICFYK